MMQKAKILYFTVFILVVIAFIFHVTAMGHHHWKRATARNSAEQYSYTTIGLFTRCIPSISNKTEACFPNRYPAMDTTCLWSECLRRFPNDTCRCDFLPSTKGIAACTIIASVFLGIAIILLFVHSIKTKETRMTGLLLGFLPLILLFLAFCFILTALILVGSYLSRDMMHYLRDPTMSETLDQLRTKTRDAYQLRVDWSTGLEIIALVFTFFSFILYSIFVFKRPPS